MAVVDRVVAPDEAITQAPPRRRWGRWLLAVLVVSLVAVCGAGLWAAHYQPLVLGGLAGVQASGSTRVVSTDDSEGTTYRVVDPDVGTTVTLSMSYLVESSAPFATTLESVGSPFTVKGDPQSVGFVDDVQVTMARGLSSEDYQPFSPQRVAPGETISLRVAFTIPDCPRDEPGQRIADTVPITYRFFGVTHTARLPMGYPVAIQNGVACRTWTG